MIFRKKLLAGTTMFFMAGGVAAAPTDLADLQNDSGETLFSDVPEGKYSDTGAGYVELTDQTERLDDVNTTLLAESPGMSDGSSFGIFDQQSGDELEVFQGGADPLDAATIGFDIDAGTATNLTSGEIADIGTTFGFYLENGEGGKFFSDPSMNPTLDHALLFDTTSTSGEGLFGSNIVVAMEDQAEGDGDYNDVVVGLTDVVAADVPEPGTLALLGMGLLGIGASRFRKS